jgi:hypothetical protein
MEHGQFLSWLVGVVGLTGFYFSGKKVWWSWYINLGCQILWVAYALVTGQPAFLATAAVYSVIFGINAYKWTKDHRVAKKIWESEPGTVMKFGKGTTITRLPDKRDDFNDAEIELIARTCHEANRVLQLSHDDENPSYPWHLAQDWQKASAIEGVRVALDGATAEELHESWVRQKLADGWVYGPVKDEGIKTHPCLVPYSELPEEQRIKDHMFRAIVKSFKLDKQYADISKN